MPKNWFYRLLLSYLPMFFVSASILILITFLVISDLTKKEAVNSNRMYIQHIMQTIDNHLHAIDQAMIKEISTNELFRDFFTKNTEDAYWENYRVSVKLNEFQNSFPLIDSVYLFRRGDGMVLSRNTMLPMDDFGDHEFIHKLLDMDDVPYPWTSPRAFGEFNTQTDTKRVVSIVRKVPLLSGNYGMMVANVEVRALHNIIREMSHSQINFVSLFDGEGRPIVQAGDGPSPETIEKGKDTSFIESNYTGWVLQSGIKGAGMFQFVSIFSYIWMIFALLTVVLGAVWIIYVSRKNYQPIQSVLKSVQRYSRQKSHELMQQGGYDEFKFIESSIDKLLEEVHQFQEKDEENLIYRRRYFFQELLAGEREIDIDEWTMMMKDLKLNPRFKQLAIVLIDIDSVQEFHENYNPKDQYLLKYVLQSVVKEVAEGHELGIWTEWIHYHQLGVLCQFETEVQTSEGKEHLKTQFEEVRGWVEDNLHFTVSIGIGTIVNHVEDVPRTYGEAKTALTYRMALGRNVVIHYKDVAYNSQYEVVQDLPLIHALTEHVRLDEAEWEQKLKQLFEKLKTQAYSDEENKKILNYMAYYLHQMISELSVEYQEVWRQAGINENSSFFKGEKTLDELYAYCHSRVGHFLARIREMREQRANYSLITEIKAYVDAHYANPDLSLKHLSDQFKIQANYLSRLFKEETGENFVDYLVSVRMNQAKKQLLETQAPVQEIANQVGYIHANSFIRTFKKVTGMTPGDYRKQGIMK